jgi:hypothetical protein
MTQYTDPFSAPAEIQSSFPKLPTLNGALIIWEPVKVDRNHPGMTPGTFVDRFHVNVTVVDRDVPGFNTREFKGMYISGQRMTAQLEDALKTGGKVLGRLGLYKPNMPAGKGNPWGIQNPTDDERRQAVAFLNKLAEGQFSGPSAGGDESPF